MIYADNVQPQNPFTPQIRFSAIGDAWRLVIQNRKVWIPVSLLYVVLTLVVSALARRSVTHFITPPPSGHGSFVIKNLIANSAYLVALPIGAFLRAGLYRISLKQVYGEEVSVGDLFQAGRYFLPVFIAILLLESLPTFGVIPGYVPGLLFAGVEMFALPLILDKKMSALAAIKESWLVLRKNWLQATVFVLVSILVGLSGCLLLLVGLVLTFPIYPVSVSLLYRDCFGGGNDSLPTPTLQIPLPPASAYGINTTNPPLPK